MKKTQSILSTAAATLAGAFVLALAAPALAEQGKSTQVTRSNISNNRAAAPAECVAGEACESADGMAAPRDAASGQATGKRQHKPMEMENDGEGSGDATTRAEVASPRDAASGLPTGRRQHKPMRGDGATGGEDMSGTRVQDHNSSRSNKTSSSMAPDGSEDGEAEAPTMKAKPRKTK